MSDLNTLLGICFPVTKPGSKTKAVMKVNVARFIALAKEIESNPERFVEEREDLLGNVQKQVTLGMFEAKNGNLLLGLWENRDESESVDSDQMPD